MKNSPFLLVLAVAILMGVAAFPAAAGVLIQTDTVIYTSAPGPLAGFAENPNLVDGATITSTGFAPGNSVGGSDPSVVQNITSNWGFTFNGVPGASAIATLGPVASYNLLISLDLMSSPLGYDLSQIKVMSSWDNGIAQAQNYDLSYSTAAAPLVFISLGNYSLTGPDSSNQSMMTALSGPLMPTNVAVLNFTINNLGLGYTQATRRIEVYGTSTIPEPGTTVLMAIAGMGSLIFLRRKRFRNA